MRDGMTRQRKVEEVISTKTTHGWAATLVEVEGGAEGNEYPMDVERLVLGRGPDADIAFGHDDEMSAKHAAFEHTRGGFCVTDLASTNGTRVNGEEITAQRKLAHGDRIQMGEHVFELLLEKREKPPPTWVVEA